jgi:4-hydroxyphenylpyruvate dioxygenase-like putative hemolysin
MNDLMKSIQKAQQTGAAELKAYQTKLELDAKKVNTTTDRCFYLLDKIERAHIADHDKIVRVQTVQGSLEKDLDKHKTVFYDLFEMQRNEFEAHLMKMKKKLKDSTLAVQMI